MQAQRRWKVTCLPIISSQVSDTPEVGHGWHCHKEETQGSLWGCCISFLGHWTECRRLGGLNNKNSFSHSSGGWKSKIKESAKFAFFWDLSLLQVAVFSTQRPLVVIPLCLYVWYFPLCSQIFSCCKDASHTGLISFNLNYPFNGPVSKNSHILRYWWLGLQHQNLGGTQFSS